MSNGKCEAPEWRTADPSPTLRSGRDDKKERVVERERTVAKGEGSCWRRRGRLFHRPRVFSTYSASFSLLRIQAEHDKKERVVERERTVAKGEGSCARRGRLFHRPRVFQRTAHGCHFLGSRQNMTKRRGLLKGRGPLPREKAVVGAAGTPFPSTESFFSVQRMVVTS
ncbi:MAG: hypothetical protein QOE55_3748 [Acidobacteriaceae bacterium]|nr:hypothetical protein [Acidobacteriaceae bacterium]